MRHFVFLIMLILAGPSLSVAEEVSVSLRAEEWDSLRGGHGLLQQPALAGLVQRWMQTPDSLLELRYPGGEEGEIWVHELHDWLVALGIPSAALTTLAGSGSEDTLYLVLMTR